MPPSSLKRSDPQCQDCIYRALLEMSVAGRSGLRAPPRPPRGVEGNKAARSKGEGAALIFLQAFFLGTTAEFSI